MANSTPKHQRLLQNDVKAVNEVVADGIKAWGLSQRLYRLSIPAYQYQPADWIDHEFYGALCPNLCAVVVLTESLSEHSDLGRITVIHGLYVSRARQSRGMGRALVETASKWAQTHDTMGLYVKAHASAVPFFQHLGFSQLPILDLERDYPHRLWRPF